MRHTVSPILYSPANAADFGPAAFTVVMDVAADRAGADSM